MVTTDLEEKQNKKFYVPIRGGNRGGWDQFKWENVMYMPYKVRELYLGNSAMIGFLDKGGKWRKKNWYLKTEKDFKTSDSQQEMLQAKKRDEQRFKAAFGEDAFDELEEKLDEAELQQLKRKIKNSEQYEKVPGAQGLGFDKMKIEIKSRPALDSSNPYRLQGIAELPNDQAQPKEKKKKDKKDRTSSEKRRKKEKKEKKKEQKRLQEERHNRDRSKSHSNRRSRSRSRHQRAKEYTRKRRDSRQRDFSRSISMQKHNRARQRSIEKRRNQKRRRSPSSPSRERDRKKDRRHRRSRSRS